MNRDLVLDRAGAGRATHLLELARPRQWARNLLVVAAPAAAGRLGDARTLGRTALMLVVFVFASAAVYAVNDIRDAELDRRHPLKRCRPVAAGRLGSRNALFFALIVTSTALALATGLGPLAVLSVLAYLSVSIAYSFRLKHVAVLDIVAVSMGFVIRGLAGAAANRLPVSNWFLLVSLFGALYVVVGKRNAEATRIGDDTIDENRSRPVLASYPQHWLQQVLTLSCPWPAR